MNRRSHLMYKNGTSWLLVPNRLERLIGALFLCPKPRTQFRDAGRSVVTAGQKCVRSTSLWHQFDIFLPVFGRFLQVFCRSMSRNGVKSTFFLPGFEPFLQVFCRLPVRNASVGYFLKHNSRKVPNCADNSPKKPLRMGKSWAAFDMNRESNLLRV